MLFKKSNIKWHIMQDSIFSVLKMNLDEHAGGNGVWGEGGGVVGLGHWKTLTIENLCCPGLIS